jgi:hypothetical protein
MFPQPNSGVGESEKAADGWLRRLGRLVGPSACLAKLTRVCRTKIHAHTQAVVHAALLLACATVLEPLWGTPEWLRVLGGAGASSAGVAMVAAYVVAATRRAVASVNSVAAAAAYLHTPRHGAAGLIAASLVGVAQAAPDRQVTVAKAWTLRMKHVPGVYLCAAALVDLVSRGRLLATLPLAAGGAYAGWVYLRYFQAREGGGR